MGLGWILGKAAGTCYPLITPLLSVHIYVCVYTSLPYKRHTSAWCKS